MSEREIPLTGGNATAGVVRVGDTVRKPWQPSTPSVVRMLATLREAGIDVPQHFGADSEGRQIIEFVPGVLADGLLPLSTDDLRRAGALVRSIHDASASLPLESGWGDPLLPAPSNELVCHNDLTPWNLVTGERWAFIDWDGAGPSSRLWDLAYSAQAFALIASGQPVAQAATRLAAFIDGYDPSPELRSELPRTLAPRAAAMRDMLRTAHEAGREPWGAMYVAGHGAYWAGVAAYASAHEHDWALALGETPVPG